MGLAKISKLRMLLGCGMQTALSLQPTRVDRGWFVFPFGKNPWWVYLASALPALLVTILIFMDQQITAVIVNRKEHKLRVSRDAPSRGIMEFELEGTS